MIDTDNARWDLSPEEQYAVQWLAERGFEGALVKQYITKTRFALRKDGVEDTFELAQGVKNMDVKAYMEQYGKQFAMLQELARRRENGGRKDGKNECFFNRG